VAKRLLRPAESQRGGERRRGRSQNFGNALGPQMPRRCLHGMEWRDSVDALHPERLLPEDFDLPLRPGRGAFLFQVAGHQSPIKLWPGPGPGGA